MNIIDAIKSGKRFKREGALETFETHNGAVRDRQGSMRLFTTSEVLADDWKVEEPKRELSWSEIELAYYVAQKKQIVMGTADQIRHFQENSQLRLIEFKKQLGFE